MSTSDFIAKAADKSISPGEYFERLKELKNQNTEESLDNFYDAALAQLAKYKLFRQKRMIRKLMFIVDCVPKERQLLELGINTFIYKEDIEDYINNVENKVVKLIEMENYPRDIPEEFADTITKTIEIFDEFYVLFTDYTGKEEKRVAKERREKDPILFGVFKNNSQMNDRFYYLGDWVDEYCDLTLEKLLAEAGDDILKGIRIPDNKQELIDDCNKLLEKGSSFITTGSPNVQLSGNWHSVSSSTNGNNITVVTAPLSSETSDV